MKEGKYVEFKLISIDKNLIIWAEKEHDDSTSEHFYIVKAFIELYGVMLHE